MATDIVELDSYLCRRKFMALTGKIHVYDARQNLVAYSKQKALKLKEDIRVFTDETKATELLSIKARQVIDFAAAYDVTTPDGTVIGALKRQGLKSMLKDQWLILGEGDAEIGSIDEDSAGLAIVRRFVPLMNIFLAQHYHLSIGSNVTGTFKRNVNPFVSKLEVELIRGDTRLDRRLALAAAVLLLIIEVRQQ